MVHFRSRPKSRSYCLWLAGFVLIGAGAGWPTCASASVVTKVVGQVDTHFVTSREVRVSDAIDQALDATPAEMEQAKRTVVSKLEVEKGRGKSGKEHTSANAKRSDAKPDATKIEPNTAASLLEKTKFSAKILSGEEKTFPNNVAKYLDEWMISLEASSLQANPPQAQDVAAAMKRVTEYWGEQSAWRLLEVSPEELRKTVERKLLARSFEEFKNNVATAPVSDAEAFSYYQRNRLRFGNLPFSTFKENIKSFLTRQQAEIRLTEWLEVLRRKYKVRNFIAG